MKSLEEMIAQEADRVGYWVGFADRHGTFLPLLRARGSAAVASQLTAIGQYCGAGSVAFDAAGYLTMLGRLLNSVQSGDYKAAEGCRITAEYLYGRPLLWLRDALASALPAESR